MTLTPPIRRLFLLLSLLTILVLSTYAYWVSSQPDSGYLGNLYHGYGLDSFGSPWNSNTKPAAPPGSLNGPEPNPDSLSSNNSSSSNSTSPEDEKEEIQSLALGFIHKTYIISLPHRTDRRADMELLMSKLSIPPSQAGHDVQYEDPYTPSPESEPSTNPLNSKSRPERDAGYVFHPGTYSNTSLITTLMAHVVDERRKAGEGTVRAVSEGWEVFKTDEGEARAERMRLDFTWPKELTDFHNDNLDEFDLASPDSGLPLAGAELWSKSSFDVDTDTDTSQADPLICAEDNLRLTPYHPSMPQWRWLTRERVAAFHSHLSAVRRVVRDNERRGVYEQIRSRRERSKAEGPDQSAERGQTDEGRERRKGNEYSRKGMGSAKSQHKDIALILEDDVDMEIDIEQRMEVLLPLLPLTEDGEEEWDVLFLGFCWSTESTHAPLTSPYFTPTLNALHPSFQPRCLHAYALSPLGALRLLRLLRVEGFAYSRSVDLATEWLVWIKLLRSYTVVPPVVIQRKVSKTDITLVGGAVWKESLREGVLGTKESGGEV